MKNVKPILAILLVFVVLVPLSQIGLANAQNGTIYIRADGTVEGTDKIQRVGDVYTFTDNIEGLIVVEKDDIVIDGAAYTLQAGDMVGIKINERNNVTIRNLVIREFLSSGISLYNSNDCKIHHNNITDNHINGIQMTGSSSRNRITENHVQNNSVGMEIYSANPGSDNVISDNKVSNNGYGMQIKDFLYTTISGNTITSNTWGLGLGVGSGSTAKNNIMNDNTYGFRAYNVQAVNVDVDTSNTVNGKPIIYWVNQHNRAVPADACYVALIGCSGITVKNLNFAGNLEGVFLGSTTDSEIVNNQILNCLFGINLDASSNNTIKGNTITGNQHGIQLRWSSLNNVIQGNDITANTAAGIYIAESTSNKITENNITNNDKGIYSEYCGSNIIYHNNFVNNTKQWDDIGFTPWPIPLPISPLIWDDGTTGNYWSNYNGTDQDGDGIGDTPYILGEGNQDNYPLMNVIPEFPSLTPLLIMLLAVLAVGVVYRRRLSKNRGRADR